LLTVADVANFAIDHVIPGQRRSKRSGYAYVGVRNRFRQFVAGNRRVIAEDPSIAASAGGAKAALHVRMHAVKNVLPV